MALQALCSEWAVEMGIIPWDALNAGDSVYLQNARNLFISCAGKFSDVICLRTTVRSLILQVHPSWREGKLKTAGMVRGIVILFLAGQSCTIALGLLDN